VPTTISLVFSGRFLFPCFPINQETGNPLSATARPVDDVLGARETGIRIPPEIKRSHFRVGGTMEIHGIFGWLSQLFG
jgi:hypothetical protein